MRPFVGSTCARRSKVKLDCWKVGRLFWGGGDVTVRREVQSRYAVGTVIPYCSCIACDGIGENRSERPDMSTV